MKYELWPKGNPLQIDEKKLKRLLQTSKIAKEKTQGIKASSIDHVHFYVNDLKKSFQFYHDVFGFEIFMKVQQMKVF